MDNFFERVGRVWPAGRRDLHWHIVPKPREAEALVAPYQGLLRPGLAGVAPRDLHCTLMHAVGLAHDPDVVRAVVEDVTAVAAGTEPFTLTFDRPSIGAVAVEIAGWSAAPFTAVVDAVTAAMRGRGGEFRAAPSRYPHISVAYTTAGAEHLDAVGLRAALAAVAGPLSQTVHVDRLHLVEQWHDGATITWRPLAEIPLTGGRS